MWQSRLKSIHRRSCRHSAGDQQFHPKHEKLLLNNPEFILFNGVLLWTSYSIVKRCNRNQQRITTSSECRKPFTHLYSYILYCIFAYQDHGCQHAADYNRSKAERSELKTSHNIGFTNRYIRTLLCLIPSYSHSCEVHATWPENHNSFNNILPEEQFLPYVTSYYILQENCFSLKPTFFCSLSLFHLVSDSQVWAEEEVFTKWLHLFLVSDSY